MAGIIGYIRVSTKRQGESGLGLEAQLSAIEAYSKQTGSKILVPIYREVESGKNSQRPELARAISHAKRAKATLVVAKLDRLARNVAFLSALMESGIEFVACDNPSANRLTVHILAAVAEAEAAATSVRTKGALEAAKKRGTLLGSARPGHWAGREDRRLAGAKKGNASSAAARAKLARDAYLDLMPIIKESREAGRSLQAIADQLNKEGYTTRRSKPWNPMQVARVLKHQ